ncbi:hypothetical protein BpHYR1_044051 [Brachionus plicatilis]|uniref:Uncharacterized protein n=1 Tax=Brachionus plicatilis TaxID=10195 RepID=A0A3M7SES2_BRAPC|nr:hypothetical protein BpHYR1_044051 [Brachionus plicatilis]
MNFPFFNMHHDLMVCRSLDMEFNNHLIKILEYFNTPNCVKKSAILIDSYLKSTGDFCQDNR